MRLDTSPPDVRPPTTPSQAVLAANLRLLLTATATAQPTPDCAYYSDLMLDDVVPFKSNQTCDPNDRTTWTCIHPGWWLARHTLGFGKNPNKLDKRGDSTYCITAVNNITDMRIRALTAEAVTTFGDYQSLKLADYDSSDDAQHWKITKA
ncbi:hypothetical protein JCM11641_007634 [Rhodosporidiobolus odoratus]